MKYLIYILFYFFLGQPHGHSLPPASDGEALGILVMGSIVSKNKAKRENVALIKEMKTGRVKAVKKGFRLLGRYIVRAITEKYIIIWNNNEGERLVYQDKFSSYFRNPNTIAAPKPKTNSRLLADRDSFKEDGFERNKNNISMTAAYREQILGKGLSTILMQATAEAFTENGRIVGFKIYQIDPKSIYDKAGMRDGDIITSINGRKLNSAAGAINLLKKLRNSKHIEFSIRRGNSNQNLKLNVD